MNGICENCQKEEGECFSLHTRQWLCKDCFAMEDDWFEDSYESGYY